MHRENTPTVNAAAVIRAYLPGPQKRGTGGTLTPAVWLKTIFGTGAPRLPLHYVQGPVGMTVNSDAIWGSQF